MPWWLSQSAETGRDDYEAMRRRFVEASRRAEIIAMVNEANSADAVVDAVCAELCEAFEAEIGFVVIAEARYDMPRFLGCLGLTTQQQAKVLGDHDEADLCLERLAQLGADRLDDLLLGRRLVDHRDDLGAAGGLHEATAHRLVVGRSLLSRM